jgi:hypothetical protein
MSKYLAYANVYFKSEITLFRTFFRMFILFLMKNSFNYLEILKQKDISHLLILN